MNVHYYEQGNVQLSTTHTVSLDLPAAITPNTNGSASKVLALVEAEESRYQSSLNESYQEMGDKTFKSLRRALPMTRAKLDWDKVRSDTELQHVCYSGANVCDARFWATSSVQSCRLTRAAFRDRCE